MDHEEDVGARRGQAVWLPPNTELRPAGDPGDLVLEIYCRRDDCDVRLEDPAIGSGDVLPLSPGDYFAMRRSIAGVQGVRPFSVQTDRDVQVQVGQ